MKRILGILGSPRRGGNSETLARKVLEGAAENGWVTDVIRLQDLEINGCTDCRRCWSGGSPCVIDDDMDKVYEADDLVQGNNTIFVATGVTDGQLVAGVRREGGYVYTESVVLRGYSGTSNEVSRCSSIQAVRPPSSSRTSAWPNRVKTHSA